MILLLFCFLGIGVSLGEDLTTCKIADNVKSALYILDLMPEDNFEKNEDTFKSILVNALNTSFPSLETPIAEASDEQLFDLASMKGMLSKLDMLNTKNGVVDWANIGSQDVLRVGFEQLALLQESDLKRREMLSSFMNKLTTREILSLSCARQGTTFSIDNRFMSTSTSGGYLDGCYEGLTLESGSIPGFDGTTRYHCLNACRTANKKFSLFVGTDDCRCSSSANDIVGTFDDNCDATATTKMLKTGLGQPIETTVNAGVFDVFDMGFRQFENDDLISLEEVEMTDGSAKIYIAALFKKALALFKQVDDNSNNLELVDWKRWDCPTQDGNGVTLELDEHCLHKVAPLVQGADTLPGFANLNNSDALAFTNFNVLATLSHVMTLNSEGDFDTLKLDRSVKTEGSPMVFPGGKMINHILISFDKDSTYKMALLRLENDQLVHMTESLSFTWFFGQFRISNLIDIAPHIFTHRVIGRDSYVFVGLTDDTVAGDVNGEVKLYTLKEEQRKITDYAFYGAISMDENVEFSISTFKVQDILYAQTIYPLLIVLDINPNRTDKEEARIRVFRINKFVNVDADKPLDEIIVDEKYSSLEFVSLDTGKYVVLKSADTMIYLEISSKGVFAREIKTFPGLTFKVASVKQFGRLKDNVIISTLSADSARYEMYDFDGNKLDETPTDQSTGDYKAMECVSGGVGYLRCITGSFNDEKGNFDTIKSFPYSKLAIVSNDVTLTNWEAYKKRIDNMFDDLTPIYNGLIEKQKGYLMTEGSIVPSGSTWQLNNLRTSELIGAAGVLDGTAVTMNVVNPTTNAEIAVTYTEDGAVSSGSNVRKALDIQLDEVRTCLTTVTLKTSEFKTKFESSKLSLGSTSPQTISNVDVNTLDADSISSVDAITVNELKSSDGTTKLLSTINTETFRKSNPQALEGLKTFKNLITIDNLETAQLADDAESKVSVSPADCFVKNRETTITVPQTFVNPVTVTAMKLEGDSSIVDTDGSNIKKEDLVPHNSRLTGFFSFQDEVSANGLNSAFDGFELNANVAANMALKATANTITGDLTVNIIDSEGNNAFGSCILLEQDVLLNSVNLFEKKQNSVRISCDGCSAIDCSGNCAENVVQINSPVTFTGTVSAPSLDLTTLNSLDFDKFIDKSEFNSASITITGKKTLSNVNAKVLKAATFHGLELVSLLTINSDQEILSAYTFNKVSEFSSINAPLETPCVPVDGQDLCLKFKSDLEAVNQGESWITNNNINTDVKFIQLTISTGASIEFDNKINSMIVNDVIEKIVTDENKAFTITGTKTISSNITLQKVQSSDNEVVNIIFGTDTYVISDFVNTETSSEISGAITFSFAVTFEDIFTVGTTLINDLSVAHMLHCFVDNNADLSDDIHIHHPVHYDKISVPKLEVVRDPNAQTYNILPLDDTIQTAAKFIGVSVDEKIDSVLKSELIAEMSTVHGITITDNENFSLNVMFSFVLKDLPKIDECDFIEKRNQMNIRLNVRFGLTMTSLQAKTHLEMLQLEVRRPKINNYDPSTDLAIVDRNNEFCTAEATCIQRFNGGIEADSVTVTGNLKIQDNKLVHSVNPSTLDAARISLTRANNNVAPKTFSSLSLQADNGIYSGNLQIETSDGFISSSNFASKFLSTTTPAGQTQTVSGSLVMSAIQADSITTNQLKIKEQVYDISAVDAATKNIDDDLTFDELTFNDAVTIHNAITLVGTLDGETISEFHGILVDGEDIVVDSSTSIAGTNRAELSMGGTKIFSSLTVDNLKAIKDTNGNLIPDFAFLPCTKSEEISGPLIGELLKTEMGVANVNDCQDKCRDSVHGMCYGISYLSSGGICRVYSSYEADVVDDSLAQSENYVSFTLECCCRLQVQNSNLFLSVDVNDFIITSSSPDFWCFGNNDKIVHKSTDKLIALDTDGVLVLSDVPRSSSKSATLPGETFIFSGTNMIQIQSSSTSKWMNKDENNDVVLQDSAVTSWEAFMGGVIMSELVDGEIEPRLLLKSKAQTVTGTLAIKGDATVEDSSVITPTISTLSHDEVTNVYNYNTETSTHEISTNYEITGSSLAVTNLDSASYDNDLNDFIHLDTTAEDLKLLGNTKFTDVTFNTDLTVDGNVAGHDIVDLNTNLARNHDGTLEFTQKNTFSQNADNSATLISSGFTSTVDMTLGNSQIQNGVDVVDLRAKTILNDDATATIKGTVNFDTILVSEGSLTMGKANLNGGGEIDIPAAFILNTNSSIDLTAHKVGTFKANKDLTIKGQLFGYEGVKFLDVLYKDGAQIISADFDVTGQIATIDLTTTTINGFTPEDDLILLDGEVTMDADTTFTQTLTFTDLIVSGKVDSFDFIEKFKDSIAVLDKDNTISGNWTIESAAQFDGDVVGTETVADHFINKQRISDLHAVCDLHDNIYAVKISAQAEASVLCDFVSDLQDSYLSGQDIVSFTKKSSTSFTGKSFTNSVMKKSEAENQVYLFVMNGLDLEIYNIDGSDIQMVKMLTVTVFGSGVMPKIPLVIDISGDTGFKFLVFVGTGIPGDGVKMLKFSGTSVSNTLESIGSLADATTVSEVNMHYIVVLKHTLDVSDGVMRVSLFGYTCNHLKTCETDCANITPDTLLNVGDLENDEIKAASPGEILDVVSMRAMKVVTGQYVVAFNMNIKQFDQNVIRIVMFEKTEGVFSQVRNLMDSCSTPNFELAMFDAKLFLLVIGTTLEMKEINAELGTINYRTLANPLTGSLNNLHVDNLFGSGYSVSVLKDGKELITMKYWGLDGLRITSKIMFDNYYTSVSCTTAVVDSKVVFMNAVVGTDRITVFQGDFASQNQHFKFECAKPEVPAAWIST